MDGLTDKALERLFDEARQLVKAQQISLQGLDNRLASLLRFEALLLGVLVTILSALWRAGLWADFPAVSQGLALLTVALLLASTLLIVLAYQPGDLSIGLRARSITSVLEMEADDRALLRKSIHAYTQALSTNRQALNQASRRFDAATWTLIASLATFASSAMTLWVMG